MTNKSSRGFTLIELLVVIAIIGVLSTVVLAALNNARDKGSNGAVKANLLTIRAQAELFYDTPVAEGGGGETYTGLCDLSDPASIMYQAMQAAAVAGGAVS